MNVILFDELVGLLNYRNNAPMNIILSFIVLETNDMHFIEYFHTLFCV